MKVAAYALLCSALLAMPAFAWDEPSADDAAVSQPLEASPIPPAAAPEPHAEPISEAVPIMDDTFYDCECNTCGLGCECDCNAGKFIHGLLCGPDNMFQHTPYLATPKTYYYFRPYNFMHVRYQQGQAQIWGADPGMPYSNAVFQDVYKQIESGTAGETILPPPIAK